MTDTVKSIVPSWLQKYFKNGEAAEEGEVGPGGDHNCQPLSPPPPPPPNGNEEGPPPVDGRDSPEPSTSNAGRDLFSRLNLCLSWGLNLNIFFMFL